MTNEISQAEQNTEALEARRAAYKAIINKQRYQQRKEAEAARLEIEELVNARPRATFVSHHSDMQMFNGDHNSGFRCGCFVEVRRPYGGSFRVYEPSYVELLATVKDMIEHGESFDND